jgi:predicted MFS family arabinose efflux permease
MSDERRPKGAWGITTLLFSFMLINFADKTVVGLAAVPIMRDLHLTPRQFGFLGSSFSFLFAVSGILVGFVANRIATRWVLLALAFSWAVVQFQMVGAAGFTTLVACRVLLGAGEGPAFSVAVHALYKWFPDQQRTLPMAVLTQVVDHEEGCIVIQFQNVDNAFVNFCSTRAKSWRKSADTAKPSADDLRGCAMDRPHEPRTI